jgi:hypothetical protein
MEMGTIPSTIFFVMALVSSTILGAFVLAYAAHCFLVVMEGTSAGMDDIPWPDDPFLDWLWMPIYLLCLLAFWALVAGLGLYLIDPDRLWTLPGLAGVAFVALWLGFPISLYSSLGARSLLSLLYLPLLRRLVRRLGHLLALYLLTLPVLAVACGLVYQALTSDWWWLLPAAVLAPMAMFIHARLLGRLGWLISYRTPLKKKKTRKAANPLKKLKVEVVDPWSFPEEEREEGLDESVPGETAEPLALDRPEPLQQPYGVMSEDQARQSWAKGSKDTPLDTGYAVAPPSATPGHDQPPPPPPVQPLPMEERLRRENQPPQPPRYVFWSGVLAFPFYLRTLGPWFFLAFCGLIELFFLRLMVALLPG